MGIPIIKIRPSYLYNGNPHTRKDCLDIEMGPWMQWKQHMPLSQFSVCWAFVIPQIALCKQHRAQAILLAFVRGIHQWPVDSPQKGPVMQKMFPFDDIMYMWIDKFTDKRRCWLCKISSQWKTLCEHLTCWIVLKIFTFVCPFCITPSHWNYAGIWNFSPSGRQRTYLT